MSEEMVIVVLRLDTLSVLGQMLAPRDSTFAAHYYGIYFTCWHYRRRLPTKTSSSHHTTTITQHKKRNPQHTLCISIRFATGPRFMFLLPTQPPLYSIHHICCYQPNRGIIIITIQYNSNREFLGGILRTKASLLHDERLSHIGDSPTKRRLFRHTPLTKHKKRRFVIPPNYTYLIVCLSVVGVELCSHRFCAHPRRIITVVVVLGERDV